MTNVLAASENGNLNLEPQTKMYDDLTPLSNFIASVSSPILFFNIGCPELTGDSYGPRIGTLLNNFNVKNKFNNVRIVGTLDNPVHAANLNGIIEIVKDAYKDYTIIATDAGSGQSVGAIFLAVGMLVPGTGVGRTLNPIGDYYIMGITGDNSGYSTLKDIVSHVLNKVDTNFVDNLVQRTASSIIDGLTKREVIFNFTHSDVRNVLNKV